MRRFCLLLAVCACAPQEQRTAPAASRSVLPSQASLVLLEPVAGGCEWRRVDPVMNGTEVLAKLPVPCDELTVAWNFDGTRAVIASRARLWEWSGTSAVEAPARGEPILSVGYDLEGKVYASILDGEVIAPHHPAVDSAMRRRTFAHLDGRRWTAIDPIQHEWSPLPENRPLGGPLPRLRAFSGDIVKDDALLYRLETTFRDASAQPRSVPPWRAAAVPGGVTIAQRGTEIYFVTPDRVFVPADLPPYFSDLHVRETFGLVATVDGGTARLFDLRNGSLLWKSDTAVGVTFWPLPAAATASR